MLIEQYEGDPRLSAFEPVDMALNAGTNQETTGFWWSVWNWRREMSSRSGAG